MTHSFRGFPPLGVGAVALGPERSEHMPGGSTLSKSLQLGTEERRGGEIRVCQSSLKAYSPKTRPPQAPSLKGLTTSDQCHAGESSFNKWSFRGQP